MPGSAQGTVHFEMEDGVAHLVLDRPPLNVLDIAMMRRAAHCLEEAEQAGARVVLWRGAGDRGFSSGVEIRQHTPDLVGRMLEHFHGLFRKMEAMDAVQVAAVHGFCLGGGMELVAFCDLALCTEDAVFGQPEIDVGCFPPIAAALLPGTAGPKRAAECLLTGRRLTAAEALEWGLVNRVVPDAELEERAEEMLAEILDKSPVVLALTRRALREGRGFDFEERLARIERIYLEDLCATEDIQEGIDAFLERRRPVWKGR